MYGVKAVGLLNYIYNLNSNSYYVALMSMSRATRGVVTGGKNICKSWNKSRN